MNPTPPPNITWHEGDITRSMREAALGQRGATVWLTGLSGSGKSTLAVQLEKLLHQAGRHAYRLDGDNVRHGLCANLGFSPEDRAENIRRIGEVARLLSDAGLITIASFISPYRDDRTMVRRLHQTAGLPFFEVYVDCPLEVAEQRDPKGLYRKARAGEIRGFTGIDDPYEPPTDQSPAELTIPTHQQTLDQGAQALMQMLGRAGIIPSSQK